MVNIKFIDRFGMNNFSSQHFFRIPHRYGEKWNFSFLITFSTIKTKITYLIKKWLEVNLYIFLRRIILFLNIFTVSRIFWREN